MFVRNSLAALITLGARFNDDPANSPPAITLDAIVGNQELMAQLLQHDSVKTHINTHVKASQSKIDELTTELNGERTYASKYKEMIAKIEGTADEEDLKTGKISARQLIDKHVEAARGTWQKDYDALGNEKKSLEEKLSQLQAQIQQSKLNDLIGQAALGSDSFNKKSLKHFLTAAGGVWKLEENGSFVARDPATNNVIMGKGGQPITPQEWLAGLPHNEEFSHYFAFPNGAGSNPGGAAGQATMSRAEWNIAIANAKPDEEKALLAKRASGALRIV